MNDAIVNGVVGVFNGVVELANKAVDAGDPQKFAEAVRELHKGEDECFAAMRRDIESDESLSTEQKIEKYKQLAKDQEEAKLRCAEALEKHRERAAKVVQDVFCGLLTSGLYFAPELAKSFRRAIVGSKPHKTYSTSGSEVFTETETESTESETTPNISESESIETE